MSLTLSQREEIAQDFRTADQCLARILSLVCSYRGGIAYLPVPVIRALEQMRESLAEVTSAALAALANPLSMSQEPPSKQHRLEVVKKGKPNAATKKLGAKKKLKDN